MLNVRHVSLSILVLAIMLNARAQSDPLEPAEIAPGVFTMASSHLHGDANTGWIVAEGDAILIGAPDAATVERALAAIEKSGKSVKTAVLTHLRKGELEAARVLAGKKIELIVNAAGMSALRAAEGVGADARIKAAQAGKLGKNLEVIPFTDNAGSPELSVLVSGKSTVLFAGEIVINGPHAPLPGTHTARWIADLDKLGALKPAIVVPGRGYVAGPEAIDRMRNFLIDLRRQVGHRIARGELIERIIRDVKIPTEFSATMPYDFPTPDDIKSLYAEMTMPNAPFDGRPFDKSDKRPKALVIYGDQVHDPLHLGPGLQKAMDAAGIDARLSVDPYVLNAENLAQVDLFVILRDGSWWTDEHAPKEHPYTMWMKPEQEQALKDFVERGGGLLALHNCTGLYPEGGEYIKLLGGVYNGHGPMEHFSVHVTDPGNPIVAGVNTYQIWDEQHTPILQADDLHHFLESESAEGVKSSAGWTRTQGKGRVCYLANGHSRQAINHPEFQKLMVNAAHWCLGPKAVAK